jgi:tryptophanyl-tRNA synthetase
MLLTEIPKLAGTDGRKMSKSYGNAVYLKDDAAVIRAKIAPMVTDTRRKRRSDPGEPNDCPVFTLHKAFVAPAEREILAAACRTATVGSRCKKCHRQAVEFLTPLGEGRP